jgi:DNA polymerase III epsilon subunit-like protein
MTLVFLDLETTGLNPRRHEVMQIAAVAADRDFHVVEEFEVKVHVTGRNVPRGVLRRTRYDPDVWRREAISPKYAAFQLARFLRRHSTRPSMGSRGSGRVAQLVAHNAEFDGPFLEAWSRRLKVRMPVSFRAVCTIQRAEWYFIEAALPRPRSMTLLSLCEHFGVDFRPEDAHEALADARATLALYSALSHAARRADRRCTRPTSSRDLRWSRGGRR